jgi:hypothetical protein
MTTARKHGYMSLMFLSLLQGLGLFNTTFNISVISWRSVNGLTIHNLLEMVKKLLIGQFFFCNSEFLERKENTKQYWGKIIAVISINKI